MLMLSLWDWWCVSTTNATSATLSTSAEPLLRHCRKSCMILRNNECFHEAHTNSWLLTFVSASGMLNLPNWGALHSPCTPMLATVQKTLHTKRLGIRLGIRSFVQCIAVGNGNHGKQAWLCCIFHSSKQITSLKLA